MEFACEGAPRDLGLDQGRAIGEGVDAELVRILRHQVIDHGVLDVGRDIRRHHPHLAERAAGLARGARVDCDALWVALARTLREPEFLFQPGRALAAAPAAGRAPLLAGRFDLAAERCSVPVVRRSRPQGGFASVELTLPWLVSSLGGVNARGLAVMLAPAGLALLADAGTARADAASRAPGMLLVQQCLERFDRVDTAVEWCRHRPAAGALSLLLGDAEGRLAAVEIDDELRRVVEPGPDRLLRADRPGPVVEAASAPSAPEGIGSALGAGCGVLPGLLDGGGARGALAHRAFLWLDPAARRMGVLLDHEGVEAGNAPESYRVEAGGAAA